MYKSIEDLECRYSELGEMLFKLAGHSFIDRVTQQIVLKGLADEMQKIQDNIKELKREL